MKEWEKFKRKGIGKRHYTKKNGVYHGRYVDRFGDRRSVYGTTVKEVKAKLAEAELNEQKLSNIVDEKITLDEWYEKWMRVYKEPVVRLSTKNYIQFNV